MNLRDLRGTAIKAVAAPTVYPTALPPEPKTSVRQTLQSNRFVPIPWVLQIRQVTRGFYRVQTSAPDQTSLKEFSYNETDPLIAFLLANTTPEYAELNTAPSMASGSTTKYVRYYPSSHGIITLGKETYDINS